MCILFIYTNPLGQKGRYRIIIASNRDEFYKRPAKQAFHCPETNIIGGRDMEPGREGGMWLGLSLKPEKICFGALLNVTGADKTECTSGRGPLVYNYLKTPDSVDTYLGDLNNETYSPFNLVTVEADKKRSSIFIHHHTNTPETTIKYSGIEILGFGNSNPGAPLKKVMDGRMSFAEIVQGGHENKTELVESLLSLLKCQDRHLPDLELQRRAPDNFQSLSQIFVKIVEGGYGTRTHSIILVDSEFNVEFIEHTLKEPININHPEWVVNEIKARL